MRDVVDDLALEHGLADAEFLEVRNKVMRALYTQFEKMDSGVGEGQCDFWVKHGDVEYKIVLKPNRSLKVTQ